MSVRDSNKPKVFQIALVGFGYWGTKLARVLQANPHGRLLAICDISPARREKARKCYPEATICAELAELKKLPNLQALVIATPAHHHFEAAYHSLSLGLHTLVEKPLTLRSPQTKILLKLAESQRLVLMVDHTQVYSPAFTEIQQLIDDETIGTLRHVACERNNPKISESPTLDVSVLWDLGSHDLSLLGKLFQEPPREVSARATRALGSLNHDSTSLHLRYRSHSSAAICNDRTGPTKVRSTTLVGSKKTLHFDDMLVTGKVRLYDISYEALTTSGGLSQLTALLAETDFTLVDYSPEEPLEKMCADFISCSFSGKAPRSCANSAHLVIAIIEAAERSILAGGCPTQMSEGQLSPQIPSL